METANEILDRKADVRRKVIAREWTCGGHSPVHADMPDPCPNFVMSAFWAMKGFFGLGQLGPDVQSDPNDDEAREAFAALLAKHAELYPASEEGDESACNNAECPGVHCGVAMTIAHAFRTWAPYEQIDFLHNKFAQGHFPALMERLTALHNQDAGIA